MKISYNWLKWYIPDAPEAGKLADIITYHLAEVETVEEQGDDKILDIKILPNRAHDLLSHKGIGEELSSLLEISYVDPTPKYKIPESKPTTLKIEVKSDKCRRYMGRIVRNVKSGPSPDWVVKHLESIGQRSINSMVDAANLVMFNTGQPTHVFDLDKVKEKIIVRMAEDGEELTTLDNRELKLKNTDLVIADAESVLGLAGVKGGKSTEVDANTKNIIIEVANFDPVSIRKSAQSHGIFTDARKRFENDLSPELASYGMIELSALIAETCPEAQFEEIVDYYPKKQEERKLKFRASKISEILGSEVSVIEIGNILERYKIGYKNEGDEFEIVVPPMRLDLTIEEDMAEEIGRIMGYDKVKPNLPKINFIPKTNEVYAKTMWARNKLLEEGYSEVMTYVFRDKGEVEVMQSASDKKFLRKNLSEGLAESLKLNKNNAPVLGLKEVKIFEIGAVWTPNEEVHVAYNEKDKIVEMNLDEYVTKFAENSSTFLQPVAGTFRLQNSPQTFNIWPLYPFIVRDMALWVPEGTGSEEVMKVIKENAGELVVRGPELFDEFKKDGKVSYAFRTVFQSYEKTLTDEEVNGYMEKIKAAVEAKGWQVR